MILNIRGATNLFMTYIKKNHYQRPVSVYKVAVRDVDVLTLFNTVSNLLFVYLISPSFVLRSLGMPRGTKVVSVFHYISTSTYLAITMMISAKWVGR